MPFDFDPVLELALIERQCREAIERKLAALNGGEAWEGLDDAQNDTSSARR